MTISRERAAILGITALAVVCRLAAIDQPMRFDEAVSWAYYVGRPWATIVGTYGQPNNHVFYSLLAKLVAAPTGYAAWALRIPAFIAGVAVVPLTWAVGRRVADSSTALLAAALSVGSTQLVLYSTNARGYTLVVALFLGLLLVAESLRARPTTGRWMTFALLGALGLYTIPVMLYPLGVVVVWLLLTGRTISGFILRLAVACVAIGAIAATLYSPIILSTGLSSLTGNKFVTPSPWPVFVNALPGMIVSTAASWTSPLPLWCAPVLVVIALFSLVRTQATGIRTLVLATVIGSGVLLLATHRAPFVRVWLFLLPLFLICVANGAWWCIRQLSRLAFLQSEWSSIAVAGIMMVAALTTHAAQQADDTGAFRPAERMTAILAPMVQKGDRVLAPIPSIGPLLYYFPRAGADTTLLTVALTSARRAFLVLDTRHGQTLAWAVANKIIDPVQFSEPRLLARYSDGELWETTRR